MNKLMNKLAVVVVVFAVAACGSDGKKACDPVAQTGCDQGQTCEVVQGGDPACFAPVVLRGKVFDLATQAAISGARVVALDVNGAPTSSVAITDAMGAYELPVPSTRTADGTPIAAEVTLRADAQGYVTFPSGVRQSLPIDIAGATMNGGKLVVMTTQTDIGLDVLAGGGTGKIHGKAPNDMHAGTLVVAETGSPVVGTTAIADKDGNYAILNLKPGTYTVQAYARGVNYTPGMAMVNGDDKTVDLAVDASKPASMISGNVTIVNPGMGTGTSVILVVDSTFDPNLGRGVAVPGLRAPDPGIAPNVTGAFSITGVPAGKYAVLAAFENDFLVRDESAIGGTAIVHIDVASGMDQTLPTSFKVTGALDVISPGANGPEMVTGTPVFTWKDDSGEQSYDLTVFDTFGNVTWQHTEPKHTGDNPAVPYGGPALVSGRTYQFRASSLDNAMNVISRTEDLKGVFIAP